MRLLICTHQVSARSSLTAALSAEAYLVEAAGSIGKARHALQRSRFDVVLLDAGVPGSEPLALLEEVRQLQPFADVIVMTEHVTTAETAVAAMGRGATDYLTKPLRLDELVTRLRRLRELRELRLELGRLRAIFYDGGVSPLVAVGSPAMSAVRERIRFCADSLAPVLVLGERGAGKQFVGRAIHELGPRQSGALIAAACRVGPDGEPESQLFGRPSRGDRAREEGCFEQARGGTLLLRNVDHLTEDLQARIVSVLRTGTLEAAGGGEDVPVDVRLVATIESDPTRPVEECRLQEDLRREVGAIEVNVPPLREREDDVLILARHFLGIFSPTVAGASRSLSGGAAALLRKHSWPGNVDELRCVMAWVSAFSDSPEITAADLPEYLRRGRGGGRPFQLHLESHREVRLPGLVRQFEQAVVDWALRRASSQERLAAELLGVSAQTVQSIRRR